MATLAEGGVVAVADGGEREQLPQQQQRSIVETITLIMAVAVFLRFVVFFSRFFFAYSELTTSSEPGVQISNLFEKGELLDMWFYMSENENFLDFANEKSLVWKETNIPYAVWGPGSTRRLSLKWYPSEDLKHNGSFYAHVYFARSGYSPDPNDPAYEPLAAFGSTYPVVRYMPKSKIDKWSLLRSEGNPVEWVSYWRPNITVNLVEDFSSYPVNDVPQYIAPGNYVFKGSSVVIERVLKLGMLSYLNQRIIDLNIEATTGNYFPSIYFNELWLLKDKLIPINETVTELPLNLEVGPISKLDWFLFHPIDKDGLKIMIQEGNPYLLAVAVLAGTIFYCLFEFLAYKNDIQFWNKNKSMEGLSAKSILVNFVCQLIVFLYIPNNDTLLVVLAISGLGCCIEFWKIGKAMHVEIDTSRTIPMLRFRDRDSYKNKKTKEYDDIAIKYLSYFLFFLVVCSSIYSLMYKHHRSWYSWILFSMTQSIHMSGFIMMCPQLFINYKLKSVAHMPWVPLKYKFLSRFVVQLFSFMIKLPWFNRLSFFRDDVIFLMFMYQRWIYRKRVNELGSGDKDD